MKTLYIDTHNDINIVLLNEDNIIREKKIIDQKENSTILMPTIIQVIGDNNIDEIIVINGPGSFTGVRLGVTIAKTLAYTKNIPIKTLTYLELIAINTLDEKKVVAFNDKNGYFVGYFNNNTLINDYEYLDKDEFNKIKTKVTMDFNLDFKKVMAYMKTKEALNPHFVNPIYVKKIEVEK